MTTTKKIERPEGVPLHCVRCVEKGNIEYHEDITEHGLVGEWRCVVCGKIYLPMADRQKYLELNYALILKNFVEIGYSATLKTHPINSQELKELKVTHKKLLGRLKRQFYHNEEIRVPRVVETTPKNEQNPPQNISGDHNSPKLPEFCNDWSEPVQLRWFEARDKELDRNPQELEIQK